MKIARSYFQIRRVTEHTETKSAAIIVFLRY